MPDKQQGDSAKAEMQVLEIVGCFLMFFAALLLLGTVGGRTTGDKVVNLVSAAILLAIGLGMFCRGVAGRERVWVAPVALFTSLAVVAAIAAFFIASLIPEEKETVAKAEETQEEESEQVEAESEPFFLVEGLTRMGAALKGLVKGIPLWWVKRFTVLGFALIAVVVWLVRRETIFAGVADRKWWRDLRLWTLVVMATQVVIYLLLGT